mgnify:FL=1
MAEATSTDPLLWDAAEVALVAVGGEVDVLREVRGSRARWRTDPDGHMVRAVRALVPGELHDCMYCEPGEACPSEKSSPGDRAVTRAALLALVVSSP